MSELLKIAHIESPFRSKFGIPRQAGIADKVKARIVFEPEFRSPDAVRGLEDFSHIWLIWQFSEALGRSWTPTVRPPRLGGNTRMGVFATRSPFRPNSIGLSAVKLEAVELDPVLGPVLTVSGADLLDGTPIFDIKPYIPYADSHPEASGGFTDRTEFRTLRVEFSPELRLPSDIIDELESALSQDPRPQYHDDPERVYGMDFGGYNVRFQVRGDVLTVLSVSGAE